MGSMMDKLLYPRSESSLEFDIWGILCYSNFALLHIKYLTQLH